MRHSNDAEEDATYEHDAKLTNRGIQKCAKIAASLVKEYGIPRSIVCSPFHRTRQTAEYMRKAIRKTFGVKTRIIIDPDLSRYFTSSQRANPDIRNETKSYGAIIDKNDDALMQRLRHHLRKIYSKQYHQRKEIIWCITHGVIVKKILKEAEQSSPDHVGFLEHFMLES